MPAGRQVAAPWPGVEALHHFCAEWIENDIACQFEQIAIALNQNRFITPLEDMANPPVNAVEALRIHAVELAHAASEIGFGRFDQEMIVIGHLTPGVADPVEALADLAEDFKPADSIGVGQIDTFAPIATRGDMINAAGKFKS